MSTQLRVNLKRAAAQQAASDVGINTKSSSTSAIGEKKAHNTRQHHQEGPAALAERKDAVKEYMDRRAKSTPPAKHVRAGLPKFTNIFEYLRHAPEEPMVELAKASATPAKQRSKGSKLGEANLCVEPGVQLSESIYEGWVDVAEVYSVPKAKYLPRKPVEANNAAPQQTIDTKATSKTSRQNDSRSSIVPDFNLHTEKWPSLSGILW